MPESNDGRDVVRFTTQRAWAKWLRSNHSSTDGVWIKFAKKSSGLPTVTYDEALELALCYGWIDAKMKSLDESYYVQLFVPRRPKSRWSKRNTEIVTALIEQGKMRPAGLREIERAQADGRWDAAYDRPSTATVPDDLARALKRNAKARRFFESLNKTNRYAILWQIQDAKRPDTRARRIEKFVAMLAEGKKLY